MGEDDRILGGESLAFGMPVLSVRSTENPDTKQALVSSLAIYKRFITFVAIMAAYTIAACEI
jgi:hypothetical protein